MPIVLSFAAAMALYTRIAPSGVLDLPERAQLHRLIGERPGQHLRELQRRLGSGWGALHYHLRVLHANGLVLVEKRGRHKRAYLWRDADRRGEGVAEGRGEARRILDLLAGTPRTQRQIQMELGLSRQLVAHHLKRLEADGLVAVRPGRPKTYAAAQPSWDQEQ